MGNHDDFGGDVDDDFGGAFDWDWDKSKLSCFFVWKIKIIQQN